jgi:AcrR family transcriptional regulator
MESTGRVNQKRRTRKAIVEAARAMVERGERPTVASAAEEALVSRTTAYRYFPSQESLLLELTVGESVDEFEQRLTQPAGDASPQERLLDLVDEFNRYTLANEALYRNLLRHYMELWLAAEQAGEGHANPVREGRRQRWIATALEPLRDRIPPDEFERLVAALGLVFGGEAVFMLRDVAHLEPEDAVATAHWAAEALLDASLPSS